MLKFVLAGLLVFTALPAWAAELASPQHLSAEQAAEQAHELVATARLDLSKVVVVKLRRSGEIFDVVSLQPRVQTAPDDGKASTAMAISADKSRLILLTATPSEGWRLELPIAELKPGQKLSFPVVDNAAVAKTTELEVVEVRSLP